MWWLLDRTLVDRVVTVAAETAPLPRSELVGVVCTFTEKPLAVDSVDPSAIRFALAALHRAAETQPGVAPLLTCVERAIFESAVLFGSLTGIEVDRAAADVELIAAQLVLVAPVPGLASDSAFSKRYGRWLEALEVDGKSGPPPAVPEGGEWFAKRTDAVIPVLKAMVMIRSADTQSELAADKKDIAARIREFVAGETWPAS